MTDKEVQWADIVFISAMAVQRKSSSQIIGRCKKAGLKIVAGGPLFTGEFELFDEVDHFVLNEAELTLPPFLKDLERGCTQRVYASPEFADIRKTSPPSWEIIDLNQYASMSIQFSRGCPFNFIQKSGIVTAMVGILQAPPGTGLYKRLKRERRLSGLFPGNTDGTTNIIPTMDLKILYEGYKHILRHIYSPRLYYERVRTFLLEYKAPKTQFPFDFQRLMAFFRTSVRLGVISKERFQYWRLVSWTLRNRPELLPLAITFAIYGHHFRRICESNIL